MFRRSFLLGLIFGAMFTFCSTSFAQTGSISGRVTDVEGNPIENALVESFGYTGGDGSTYSGADGNYKITDLPTGDYRVRATAKGYAREYYENTNFSFEATHVEVTASLETPGIDFNLTLGGAISGCVFRSDGVTPIAEAWIEIRPSKYFSDDPFYGTTDSNGIYIVDGLALGNYKFMAGAPDYARKL